MRISWLDPRIWGTVAIIAFALVGVLLWHGSLPKPRVEVSVTIPEGYNMFQIDTVLANAGVLPRGVLLAAAGAQGLEGKLFPDTYRFYLDANASSVVQKFLNNFDDKAAPFLTGNDMHVRGELIRASIVDKEVPDPDDQAIVAGILEKRLLAGMGLNVDASVCYAKLLSQLTGLDAAAVISNSASFAASCPSLDPLDFKRDSPYNTYLYKGLPPSPIGNPGISAISAVLHPKSSPYWYYLSDPATGKTIFAKTLDEQTANRVKYLK